MDGIRTWILGLTAAALLTAGIKTLLPGSGGVKKVGRLICGLVMILMLLQPITGRTTTNWSARLTEYRAAAGEYGSALAETNEELLADIIAERSGAYIEEAAAGQGIDCRVTVTCTGEKGSVYPSPSGAHISGALTESERQRLCLLLERELGMDGAAVTWDEPQLPG